MTLLGNRVVADVICYNEVALERAGALTTFSWCLYKEEEFGHRDA